MKDTYGFTEQREVQVYLKRMKQARFERFVRLYLAKYFKGLEVIVIHAGLDTFFYYAPKDEAQFELFLTMLRFRCIAT